MLINNYILLYKVCKEVSSGTCDIDDSVVLLLKKLLKECVKGYLPNGIEDTSGKFITALDASKDVSLQESGIGLYILYTYCKLIKQKANSTETIDLIKNLNKVFSQCGWEDDTPLYGLIRCHQGIYKIFLYVRAGKVIQASTCIAESFLTPNPDELQRIFCDSKCDRLRKYSVTCIDELPNNSNSSEILWENVSHYLDKIMQKDPSNISLMRFE